MDSKHKVNTSGSEFIKYDNAVASSIDVKTARMMKILLIDDSKLQLKRTSDVLGLYYDVITANSVKDTLKILKEIVPDLILLDIEMPEMNGYDLIKIIKSKEQLLDVPVIFLTSMSTVESEIKGLSMGAADYIKIPYSPPLLLKRIELHLDLAFQRKEQKRIARELKAAKELADQNSRYKSSFLASMSHEIRTPMNAILGITEIQLQNEMLDPGLIEALEKIYNSGDMLLGIINDILDLSKIEAGKLELQIDKYDTASLIHHTVQLNMIRIGDKPIDFELYVDKNLPILLRGDELRIKQILNNILSNAFKYTSAGKVCLSISSTQSPDNNKTVILIFKISDTGQGMTKEQVDKLFDEYSRFNMEANRTTEGTGLGMSITRNLIQLMDGEIRVESELGLGSTFIISIPQGRISRRVLGKEVVKSLQQLRARNLSQLKRAQISHDPMPYGSVLIVDDMETNIYVTKGLLSSYKLKMDSAESGYEAIEKVKDGNIYDIIFMDHMMPKMDGIAATKIIRDLGYKHPIVALTANAISGQSDVFLNNGFDDFISKPIDIRQMNTVLNKLIRDKQPPEVLKTVKRKEKVKNELLHEHTDPELSIGMVLTEMFLRDAVKSLTVLEDIIKKGTSYNDIDLRTYIIHVHGIKGALANIGKAELSSTALRLESLGREGNIEAMMIETPAFLSKLWKLVDELTPDDEIESEESEEEDLTYVLEKLNEIKVACDAFDESTINKIIMELRKNPLSKPTKELLRAIAIYLLHSEFEEAAKAVENYMISEHDVSEH